MLIIVDVWIVSWWREGTGSPVTDTMSVKYKKQLLLFWAWKARLLHRASHSFVAHWIVNDLNVLPSKLNVGMVVSTPLGKNINIDEIYKWVILYIEGVEIGRAHVWTPVTR